MLFQLGLYRSRLQALQYDMQSSSLYSTPTAENGNRPHLNKLEIAMRLCLLPEPAALGDRLCLPGLASNRLVARLV